jgi:hypothetical protein
VRRSAWLRLLALGLAVGLALILVAAAGHHHDSSASAHECGVCAVLADELPCPDGLPAVVATVLARSYPIAVPVAYHCLYRCPRLMPPICGPPLVFFATLASPPFVLIS